MQPLHVSLSLNFSTWNPQSMYALLYVAMLYTFNSVNECSPQYDCCGPPCIIFCHTLGLSLVPQQTLHYFQLVISVWQDFKLRFILGSSPENRNALGSAVVDNLHQERPRLKYGSFFFFFLLPWRSHSLWRIATRKKKDRNRGKEAVYRLRSSCLFYEWWYWVRCSRQNQSYVSSEKPNWKKKKRKEMYT